MKPWQGLPPEVKEQYAVVHLVKRTSEKELVLLQNRADNSRVLLRNYPGDLSTVYQLLAEKSLDHIPKVLTAKPREGGYYVLEQFVEGKTLNTGPLPAFDTLQILHQLCVALSALHTLHIVHRDIKPDNLLLTEDGKLYLLDLDAARLYKTYIEKDTIMLGTAGFAAPEQFGIVQTDHRADIFALGVTLNILLTGYHPSKQLCTGWMRHIVLKCTQIDPKARFQNANQVWKAVSVMNAFSCLKKYKRQIIFASGTAAAIALMLVVSIHIYSSSEKNPEALAQNDVPGTLEHTLHVPTESFDPMATTSDTTPESSLLPENTDPTLSASPSFMPPKHSPSAGQKPSIHTPPASKPGTTAPADDATLPQPSTVPTSPTTPPIPPASTTPISPVPPMPDTKPNDITQQEGYYEVKSAHEAYCRAAAKSVNATYAYSDWVNQPYFEKQSDYARACRLAEQEQQSAKLEVAVCRENLERLNAAEPPDKQAIEKAQITYEEAQAKQRTADEKFRAAQNALTAYEETPEYLAGKLEEDKRWDAQKEADALTVKAKEKRDGLLQKYPHLVGVFTDDDIESYR